MRRSHPCACSPFPTKSWRGLAHAQEEGAALLLRTAALDDETHVRLAAVQALTQTELRSHPPASAGEAQSLRPVQSKLRVPLFAACTLNATGQHRVMLSLW